MASHPQETIMPPHHDDDDICAKLVTTHQGRREAVILKLNKPARIGRNPRCDYVVNSPFVSGEHCEISVVRSSHGGVIVSCQDLSRNGILLNGHRINKSVVILMHGDVVEIPSLEEELHSELSLLCY